MREEYETWKDEKDSMPSCLETQGAVCKCSRRPLRAKGSPNHSQQGHKDLGLTAELNSLSTG